MKIVCPSCQAQYEVPESVLTSRRKMRCARCGGDWVPGDVPAPGLPAAVEDDVPPLPPQAEPEVAAPQPGMPHAERPEPGEEELVVTDEPALPSHPFLPVEDFVSGHADASREPVFEEPVPPEPVLVEPALEEPVLAKEAPPPRPVALRPETPVTSRAALPDPAAIVVPPRAPGPPVMGWAVSLALVVGLAASAVIYRAPIMKAWPPSTRVYAGLGLAQAAQK